MNNFLGFIFGFLGFALFIFFGIYVLTPFVIKALFFLLQFFVALLIL